MKLEAPNLTGQFTVIDAPQRSQEWFAARLGRLTSSRAADILATLKSGGEAAGRRNYRMQLALERVTGKSQERGYVNQAMQDGIDREPDAYAAYEALTGSILTRTGFCQHTTLMAGCSLDGHAGDFEGLIEIKCPMPATHWEYLKSGRVPGDYLQQITHALWITGAQWCDWMSFHPDFPESLQAKIVRVPRDENAIAIYQSYAVKFLEEVETECNAIRTLAGVA